MVGRIRSLRRRASRRSLLLEPLEIRNLLASFTTAEDTPLLVTDAVLQISAIESAPAHGTVTPIAAGGFSYAPAANYHGADSFIYRSGGDATTATTATVSLTITPVNDAPVAVNDSFAISGFGVLEVPLATLLANDTDVDSNALTASIVDGSGPEHGTLKTINGLLVYCPSNQFAGTDSFSYFASDGQVRSATSATVSITVELPKAHDNHYGVRQGETLTVQAPGVLENDGGSIRPLVANLVNGPERGTLSLHANGGLTYIAPTDYTGYVTFTYRASEPPTAANPPGTTPLFSNTATVTITVNPANTPPLASDDSYTVHNRGVLAIPAPGVLANDGNPIDMYLRSELVTSPASGNLVTYHNGAFVYDPADDFVGVETFTYRVTHALKTVASDVATVTITVTGTNVPPLPPPPPLPTLPGVARDDSYTVIKNDRLSIPHAGLVANDDHPPSTLNNVEVVTLPASGTLFLNTSGGGVYYPAADFVGVDSFTYRVTNPAGASNVATVTITVQEPSGPPPVARDDEYTATPGIMLLVPAPGVLANDGDATTRPLVATLVRGTARGSLNLGENGALTYVPKSDFTGVVSFTYRASSPTTAGSTATVTITVKGVNDPPPIEARNDTYLAQQGTTLTINAPGVLANDGGAAAHPLAAAVVNGPANGTLTLNANGSFVYVPNGDFSGPDSFVYRATSSASGIVNSSTATVTVIVAKPNPLHNTARPQDVDGNSEIAPLDALLIINHLNRLAAEGEAAGGGYFDVSGDGEVAPLDALLVINWLNAQQAGAEGEGDVSAESDLDETLALLSIDAAEQSTRRKRIG